MKFYWFPWNHLDSLHKFYLLILFKQSIFPRSKYSEIVCSTNLAKNKKKSIPKPSKHSLITGTNASMAPKSSLLPVNSIYRMRWKSNFNQYILVQHTSVLAPFIGIPNGQDPSIKIFPKTFSIIDCGKFLLLPISCIHFFIRLNFPKLESCVAVTLQKPKRASKSQSV